jgi:hypothetical protein
MRRNTVLLGLRDRLPNCTHLIQIRFGRYQVGQNPNRASLSPRVTQWEIIADNLSKAGEKTDRLADSGALGLRRLARRITSLGVSNTGRRLDV